MNMDGDEDLNKKIEEWLQWDKVNYTSWILLVLLEINNKWGMVDITR
jgi:hypothetical protein